MLQNNRNDLRERKQGEESQQYVSASDRRITSNHKDAGERSASGINNERTRPNRSDRENDLYERQSI